MRELTVEAKVEQLEQVKDFVEEALAGRGCAPQAVMQVMMAVDELFTNIAEYAYPQGTGAVSVRTDVRDGPPVTAEITFLDSGTPYNPLSREDPDVTLPAARRRPGGLGIFLVKKYMDGVTYERREGRNILTVRKTL